jgi:hypothetical protein
MRVTLIVIRWMRRALVKIVDWVASPKGRWWEAFVRLFPWIVAAAMVAKAIRSVYPRLLEPLMTGTFNGDLWIYTAAQNQLDWFTTGFMRRELFNTFVGLVGLTGADAMLSSALVFLFFYFMLAIALTWFVARRRPSPHQVALATICIALLFRLSFDVGRSDSAVMLCGLLAAWASRAGRWAVASTAVVVALTIHETGMIFLAPLVCAIVWEQRAWRDIPWRSVGAAAAIMAVGLGLYLISAKAQLDVHGIARHVHEQFADPTWADMAVYFNVAGFRTIQTTWCEIPLDPKFGLKVLAGVSLLALLSVTLRRKRWRVTLLAVLIPFLFMCAIATDVGRWAMLGVASILALAVTQPAEEDRVAWAFSAVALLAFPLMTKTLGAAGELTPVPWLHRLDRYPGLYTPPANILLDICDPGWRAFLGLPEPEAEAARSQSSPALRRP